MSGLDPGADRSAPSAPPADVAFLRALILWKFAKGILLLVAAAMLVWPGGGALRWVAALGASWAGRGAILRPIGVFLGEQATTGNLNGAALLSTGAALHVLIEGVGLHFRRRWAAWLTVIATSSLIPLQLYQLFHKFRAGAVVLIALNVCVVLYLVRLARRHASLWLG